MVDSDCQGSRGNRCNVWTVSHGRQWPSWTPPSSARKNICSRVIIVAGLVGCHAWSVYRTDPQACPPQPPEVEESPSADQAAGKRGEVTSKVFFDVRIITDYTNEVLEDASKRGRIVIGLYGKDSPKTVAEFLKFVRSDDSYPTYNSGMFYKHQAGK